MANVPREPAFRHFVCQSPSRSWVSWAFRQSLWAMATMAVCRMRFSRLAFASGGGSAVSRAKAQRRARSSYARK